MKLVNPIVDVRLLRARWTLTLAIASAGAFLVVASYAFGASVASALGFAVGLGVVGLGVGLLVVSRRARQYITVPSSNARVAIWEAVAFMTIALGAWNVVQTRVFAAGTGRWLTFADSLGIVAVGLIGLVVHELSTERVVHSLEVVRSEGAQTRSLDREREPIAS